MTLLRGAGFSWAVLARVRPSAWPFNCCWPARSESRVLVYTYASAWLGVLAVVSRLGYDQALVRFLPAYRAKGEWRHFRGMLRARSPRLAGEPADRPDGARDGVAAAKIA